MGIGRWMSTKKLQGRQQTGRNASVGGSGGLFFLSFISLQ